MLAISHLSKSFGGQVVLDDVGFAVPPGQKVALVGRNGCGKTTLLRIVAQAERSDSGLVVLAPGCQVGYLGQEGQLEGSRTLYQEMATAFGDVHALEAEMRQIEESMVAFKPGPELENLLARYGRLQTRFEHAEPHLVDARIRTVLHGMGFTDADLDRACREFSGGWQMRGAMARMLLRDPDLLLLDEPTNHLDLAAVEWLEEYLASSPGTVLIVSHDRYFLDRVVGRVLELRTGKIHDFSGNYSDFLIEREVRRELQAAAFSNQQKKLEQERRFIERFRYKATLATRVQSRIKMLEKRELLEAPDHDQRALKADFQTTATSGREVLSIRRVEKAYGPRQVLTGLSLEVERGERVALVGANGVGKSTLLRLLAGREKPDAGTIRAGYRLAPVYYAQHQAETLDPTRTVLEEAEAVAPPGVTRTRVRTLLGCLLFEGDEVHKTIGILSGGERSRVALARCILTPSNLLLLDEPTNHLDLSARDALLEALENYPGTILMVTHDRHFMNSLATCIVEIREGQSFRYLGNYDSFRARRNQELRQAEEARERARREKEEAERRQADSRRRGNKTPPPRGSKPIRWKLEALEKRIFELEDEVARLAEDLAAPDLYARPEQAEAMRQEYERASAEVAELMSIWDEMAEAGA
ncbi:MAG: ABC-F family ATP-binding cassette domain-containing protein [Burkholderiales bacterium]|nr:ABC-F family ATP-binding cassette domain-containing protein [Burkholderiales bacterium]